MVVAQNQSRYIAVYVTDLASSVNHNIFNIGTRAHRLVKAHHALQTTSRTEWDVRISIDIRWRIHMMDSGVGDHLSRRTLVGRFLQKY